MLSFTLDDGSAVDVGINQFVIAGWAGRDADAIQEHIEELRAIGVTPPSSTPLFYRVGANLATTDTEVQMLGEHTSGEIEVLLIGTPEGTCVGVGSDHTDREAETWSVAHSKQVCPKPVAPRLWRLSDVLPHWDQLRLASHAVMDGDRVSYQEGPVAGLLTPSALLERFGRPEASLPVGTAMLCGTLPVAGGPRPAARFEMALIDPVLGRRIEHAYSIHTLPVMA
ncbi:hypothetical protein KBTX_01094 [wastewater metagenome]|uniref:DUF2848 domain-containing protein n=2 Tax=unclassified sequences TaxID=12908 RepID=A0A5B8R7U1_9ZZZZ|nr:MULTISPECIES: DUF2848 domain-containing protein [Arhodomonas]MCS4504276.1 DUF2848 domain-containing protein [Arhodomonas aquaeolei]QEA04786.1 hypothetical protein KBTEX_01094 [uncultured organism]